MRSAGLEEAQAGIKIARRNINNLRYADDTTLMAESEEELKSLLKKKFKKINKKPLDESERGGRTDAEAPILSPVDALSQLTGRDPDAEKD